jgi:hypothetical protein
MSDENNNYVVFYYVGHAIMLGIIKYIVGFWVVDYKFRRSLVEALWPFSGMMCFPCLYCLFSVIYTKPPIPIGLPGIHRNPVESRNSNQSLVDSSRFQWIPVEFNLSLIVCNKLRMTS